MGTRGRGERAVIPRRNSRQSSRRIFYTFSSRKAESDARTDAAALAPACKAVACPCMAPGPKGEEEREEMLSTKRLSKNTGIINKLILCLSHFTFHNYHAHDFVLEMQ